MNVYAVLWERSMMTGPSRPDGVTLHCSLEEATRFVQNCVSQTPSKYVGEYSRPATHEPVLVNVSSSLFAYITRIKSVWLHSTDLNMYQEYDGTTLTDVAVHA